MHIWTNLMYQPDLGWRARQFHSSPSASRQVFPQCERQDHGFTPHMTLGQFPAKQIAQKKALYEPSIIDNFTFEVCALVGCDGVAAGW